MKRFPLGTPKRPILKWMEGIEEGARDAPLEMAAERVRARAEKF
jgi:hypothetical protein